MPAVAGPKVAVVDDDRAVRDSLAFLLDVLGYPVAGFESAADFLAAKGERNGCLILDHNMPDMTGLELAETLRSHGSVIPILLITGSRPLHIAAQAEALGIYRVLDKPLAERDLLDFIESTRR